MPLDTRIRIEFQSTLGDQVEEKFAFRQCWYLISSNCLTIQALQHDLREEFRLGNDSRSIQLLLDGYHLPEHCSIDLLRECEIIQVRFRQPHFRLNNYPGGCTSSTLTVLGQERGTKRKPEPLGDVERTAVQEEVGRLKSSSKKAKKKRKPEPEQDSIAERAADVLHRKTQVAMSEAQGKEQENVSSTSCDVERTTIQDEVGQLKKSSKKAKKKRKSEPEQDSIAERAADVLRRETQVAMSEAQGKEQENASSSSVSTKKKRKRNRKKKVQSMTEPSISETQSTVVPISIEEAKVNDEPPPATPILNAVKVRSGHVRFVSSSDSEENNEEHEVVRKVQPMAEPEAEEKVESEEEEQSEQPVDASSLNVYRFNKYGPMRGDVSTATSTWYEYNDAHENTLVGVNQYGPIAEEEEEKGRDDDSRHYEECIEDKQGTNVYPLHDRWKRPYEVIASIHHSSSNNSSTTQNSDEKTLDQVIESDSFVLDHNQLSSLESGNVIAYQELSLCEQTWAPKLSPYQVVKIGDVIDKLEQVPILERYIYLPNFNSAVGETSDSWNKKKSSSTTFLNLTQVHGIRVMRSLTLQAMLHERRQALLTTPEPESTTTADTTHDIQNNEQPRIDM